MNLFCISEWHRLRPKLTNRFITATDPRKKSIVKLYNFRRDAVLFLSDGDL